MRVEIFDVGHGACSMITSPNGRRMMIDCGASPEKLWWPSVRFQGEYIDVLAISNFDADHVTDFVDLFKECTIERFQLNNSIDAAALAGMKSEHGMSNGIAALYNHLSVSGNSTFLSPLDFGLMSYRPYYNLYGADFCDPNNLSLVLIIEYLGFKIMFPGDLERAGWEKLMENSDFLADLEGLNVFVASHHGRESGRSELLFEYLRVIKSSPEIIIISDKEKEFLSQETINWYSARATGITYRGANRSVFTTRNDGAIRIDVGIQNWGMNTSAE